MTEALADDWYFNEEQNLKYDQFNRTFEFNYQANGRTKFYIGKTGVMGETSYILVYRTLDV